MNIGILCSYTDSHMLAVLEYIIGYFKRRTVSCMFYFKTTTCFLCSDRIALIEFIIKYLDISSSKNNHVHAVWRTFSACVAVSSVIVIMKDIIGYFGMINRVEHQACNIIIIFSVGIVDMHVSHINMR